MCMQSSPVSLTNGHFKTIICAHYLIHLKELESLGYFVKPLKVCKLSTTHFLFESHRDPFTPCEHFAFPRVRSVYGPPPTV